MLPASYAVPAAVVIAAGGLLACFAGYRLFRLVLGLYGFLVGAFVTTSMTGSPDTWTLVIAILVGGLVGALLMVAAYFVGVGLVGAGLAALGLNVLWGSLTGAEPPTVLLVIVAVLGALGALTIVRHVVIVGTALAGAWTAIVGGLALAGDGTALAAAESGAVWIFYPLDAGPGRWWIVPLWIALTIAGAVTQFSMTGRGLRRKSKNPGVKR